MRTSDGPPLAAATLRVPACRQADRSNHLHVAWPGALAGSPPCTGVGLISALLHAARLRGATLCAYALTVQLATSLQLACAADASMLMQVVITFHVPMSAATLSEHCARYHRLMQSVTDALRCGGICSKSFQDCIPLATTIGNAALGLRCIRNHLV